jgi:hypothetical protein
VLDELAEYTVEVRAEKDQVIEALLPHGPDPPLG